MVSGRIAALVVVCLASTALAQSPASGWRWLQPRPTAADLRDVGFGDATNGVAVGARGAMLRSTDGGASWTEVASGTVADLKTVALSGRTGVAGGNTGTLFRSENTGATWSSVTITGPDGGLPNVTDIVDTQLVDASRGFAVASDGTVVGTTDGFRTAVMRGRVSFGVAAAIWMVTDTRGWVVGGDAAGTGGWIATTADGGRTWTRQFTVAGGGLNSITGVAFAGRAVAVAAGASVPRAVVLDEFQGRNWESIELPGGAISGLSFRALPQSDGAELWVAGEDGLWGLRTEDDTVQRPLSQTRPRIWSVASPVVGTAIAVGEGGTIVRATYGQNAATVLAGNRRERFTGGSFPTVDGLFGVFVDNQPGAPRLWVTRDGGASLSGLQVAPGLIADASFVSNRRGFAVLETGDFFTTGDGGSTFQRLATVTFRPRALAFVDERNGYAAGDGLFFTTDGAASWRTAPGPAGRVIDVAVRGTTAVAVTESGIVWLRQGATIDAPWAQRPTNTTGMLVSVSIASNGSFIAGGSSGSRGIVIIGAGAAGSAVTQQAFDRPVVSVTAVGDRFFALLDDGRITDVTTATSAPVFFSSRSRLLALVPHTGLSPDGTTSVAPFAVGDFGAVLVYDGSPIVTPPNRPPVVRLDPTTLQLAAGEVGGVTAIASDPDGDALTYSWRVVGSGVKISSPATARTDVAWEMQPAPGARVEVVVTVCDARQACTSATLIVTARQVTPPINRPPVALAEGAVAQPGDIVILDGLASSDPDGDALTYKWTQLTGTPAEMLGPNNQGAIAIVAPAQPGTLVFELLVCDPGGLCSRIEATVVVSRPNVNTPPVASAGTDLIVDPRQPFGLDASGSFDVDNEPLSFGWRQVSGPTRPIGDARQPAIRLTAGSAGEQYRFVVRVCDPANACTEAGVNVTVRGGTANRSPVVDTPQPQRAIVGRRTVLSVRATDPDGDPLVTTWRQLPMPGVPDAAFEVAGPTDIAVTYASGYAGLTLNYLVTVCDARGACAQPVTVAVSIVEGQGDLVANAGPDQRVRSGDTVTLDGTGTSGNSTVRWTQLEGPRVELTQDFMRATFIAPAGPARLVFQIGVGDASGREVTDDVVIEVSAPTSLVADAGADFAVGWFARVQLDGRNSTGPAPLKFSWKSPVEVQLAGAETATPVFHAPASDVALTFVLTVCASDGQCAEDDVVVRVTQGANLPPLVDAGPDRVGESTRSVALDGTGTRDPEGAPLKVTWTQLSGTPAVIDAADALWTRLTLPFVEAEEELVFTLEACDPRDACTSDSVTVRVLPRFEGVPVVTLSIADRPDNTVEESSEFTLVVDASCPVAACREPELVLESGPPIERVGRTGVHRTPAVSKPLRFTFRATVCDAGGRCGVATLDGIVLDSKNEAPVPVARGPQSTVPRAHVVLDASSSYDPNGDALTYRWAWVSGPVEIALTGAQTDRPRFDVPANGAIGEHRFSLEVCDVRGACADLEWPLVVEDADPANRPPVAEFGDDRAYVLGTLPLLDASASFDPDGDELTYEWGPEGQFEQQDGAKVVWTAPPDEVEAVVTLRVCDSHGACDEDVVRFHPVSIPPERGTSSAVLGSSQESCSCGGASASVLLLAGLVPLLRRRRSAR